VRLEHKAIIDRIKITAYNAEEWLLDLLVRHCPNPHDVRALLRFFAELSGEFRTTAEAVVVTLDPPDLPLHRQALRGLCADLNQLGATFPGTQLPVIYEVAVHHSEAAAHPIGRAGTPEEVGGFMAYLCTKAASWIHGQSISIDGGMVMEH